jgi:hypothetical protein
MNGGIIQNKDNMDKFSFFDRRNRITPDIYLVFNDGRIASKDYIQNIFEDRFVFFKSSTNLVKLKHRVGSTNIFAGGIKNSSALYYINFNEFGSNHTNSLFDNLSADNPVIIKGFISEGTVSTCDLMLRSAYDIKFVRFGDQVIGRTSMLSRTNIETLEMPKLDSLFDGNSFAWRRENLNRVYAPIAELSNIQRGPLGGNILYTRGEYENTAEGVYSNLDYVRSSFTEVRYVANFINPNPPTNLNFTVNSSTSITITFDLPVINTNDLDFYELFIIKKGEADEIAKLNIRDREITASNYVLNDLLEGFNYKVFLRTVDFYYNKSEKSQEIEFSTT